MQRFTMVLSSAAALLLTAAPQPSEAQDNIGVHLGPRPFYLVDAMEEGALKKTLKQCELGPFQRTDFSIGHRGAPMQFPEHTRESYVAASRMGAGILECDVTFTKDRELVCRHSQCDLHTTTDILVIPDLSKKCSVPFSPADPSSGKKAEAKCCTSDITLGEYRRLSGKMDASDQDATTVEEYLGGTANWRTELYASTGTLMTHKESIELFRDLGVKFTPELKAPSVEMPFEGDYSQENYAQQLIDEYRDVGIAPSEVFAQSFNLGDVEYWIANEPSFGAQAVYLDDRYSTLEGFDFKNPVTWKPAMRDLADRGVQIIAPPMWMLLMLEDGKIVPSPYAEQAKASGLEIITWTLERSGTLTDGGGWYYQSIADVIDDSSDTYAVLDVLARDVGVLGVFTDWPATVTYYANCMKLD